MEWGSSYVYDYQMSSEEELSGSELEEGMWLSDSEGEVDEPPVPARPPQRQSGGSLLNRLFGRRGQTAKPPPPKGRNSQTSSGAVRDNSDDDSTSDSSDEESSVSQKVEYSEVVVKPSLPSVGVVGIDDDNDDDVVSSGKYAQLAELIKEEQQQNQPETDSKISVQGNNESNQSYQTPVAAPAPPIPPPPPAPIKHLEGIIKEGGVKKQKKRRVRWDRSYKKEPKDSSRGGGVRTRRTDTNILGVKFSSLAKPGNFHTGDAEVCTNKECGAIVSHLTKLEGKKEDMDKIWVCEFCGTRNDVNLVSEEVPTIEDTTYLLAPAAAIQPNIGEGVGPVGSDSLVVFCIDTSGSMCVTTEVPGTFEIRGAKEKHDKLLQSLPTNMDVDFRRESQFVQGQRRDVTFISRMESVQAAVDTQLSQLAHTEPTKRVCLVTFSDDVVIFGDGRSNPITIAGDKLRNAKAVEDVGKEIPLPASVRDTQKALSKKIYSLEESGQTALGPAVLVSIIVASQKPGSKVVVCTDGLANIGLGGLDVPQKEYANAVNFYDDLADIALEKGVIMSLLKIKGSDCRAVELGQVASRTGGHVTLVDPLTVTEEFGSILTNPIIAMDVVSKVVLHQRLYFRSGADGGGDSSRESVQVKQVGNVTADSELTYEYGIRTEKRSKPKKPTSTGTSTGGGYEEDDEDEVKSKGATSGSTESKTTPPIIINGETNYPFQLQIEYTSLEGDKCLRVITQTKPLTKDREVAEREMDVGVVGSHVARQTAELTMQGEFTKARVKSLSAQKMLHEQSRSSNERRWEYTNFCANMIPVENEIHSMQRTETRNLSDTEFDEETIERGSDLMNLSIKRPAVSENSGLLRFSSSSRAKKPLPKRKAKAVNRRQDMSDELSVGLYGLQKTSAVSFRSPHFDPVTVPVDPPPKPSPPKPPSASAPVIPAPSNPRPPNPKPDDKPPEDSPTKED